MWHWLVENGLYGAIVSWCVFFVLGTVLLGSVRKAYKRMLHTQQVIADRLDPTTPGGISDVVQALDANTAAVKSAEQPTNPV